MEPNVLAEIGLGGIFPAPWPLPLLLPIYHPHVGPVRGKGLSLPGVMGFGDLRGPN